MKTVYLVLLSTALVGCTTLAYQEPDSGPRAAVRFATNTVQVSVVEQFANAQCDVPAPMMRLRNGPLLSAAPKRLGIPLWNHHENGAKEVYLKAGTPFYGVFRGNAHTGVGAVTTGTLSIEIAACGVPFAYTFQNGESYEVDFDQGQCAVRIFWIKKNGDGQYTMVPQSIEPLDQTRCKQVVKDRLFTN